MHGGLFQSQPAHLTHVSTAPNANSQQPPRRCYSKQQLIQIRSTLLHSHAFIELQRSKLGPVACPRAEQRWTSRIDPDGLFSCRETTAFAIKLSQSSSPSSGPDENSVRSPVFTQEFGSPHYDSSTPPESSPRTSFERDARSRMFHFPSEGSSNRRRSPSPQPRWLDHSSRASARIDGNSVPIPSKSDSKLGGNTAGFPREEKFQASTEQRRRSPSPLGSPRSHPVSSPRAIPASSFFPPGFGPQPTQKNNCSKASRAAANAARDAYYKSRICRGPNMSENFSTRIAYRRRKSSGASAVVAFDVSETTSSDRDSRKMNGGLFSSVGTGGNDHSRFAPTDKLEMSKERHLPDRPTLEYSISSDISFEDFSRRLAAEATSHAFTENEREDNAVTEMANSSNTSSRAREHARGETEKAFVPSGSSRQEEVDELKKWFRRMSATADMNGGNMSAASPESHSDTLHGVNTKVVDTVEQLDSTVLSFFDTIRSQALHERDQTQKGNGLVSGNRSAQSVRTDEAPRYAYRDAAIVTRRPVRTLESDEANGSEVERFFQLFTEGKPVYSHNESPFEKRDNISASHVGHGTSTGSLRNDMGIAENESDSGGLKRLWAELAAANHTE